MCTRRHVRVNINSQITSRFEWVLYTQSEHTDSKSFRIWCCRRADAHHITSGLVVFSCSLLDCIQDATSATLQYAAQQLITGVGSTEVINLPVVSEEVYVVAIRVLDQT